MTGRRNYSESFIAEYIARRNRGESNIAACGDMKINVKTGDRWWAEWKLKQRRAGAMTSPAPKSLRAIRGNPASRRAYDDFAYFRLVVFGYRTPPWALDAVERLRAAVESGQREFVCVNVFPGAGKTELFKHFVCWMIARNRTRRFMWLSGNDELATRRVREIRMELSRTEPGEGFEDDIATGRAQKPRYCMADLFGRFRPSGHHGATWRDGEFTVAQVPQPGQDEGAPVAGPTLVAFGMRTKMLGPRANFIVADDLWDEEADRTPEAGKAVKKRLDRTIENRLQPNGVLAVVMQRFSANDLSRYVLDKRMPSVDPVSGEETGWVPEYQHIVYPAHHDDLCDGRHPADRPAWNPREPKMGHCLTDPLALPPQDYVRKRQSPLFEVVYQQGDADPEGAIIQAVWLTGGTDADGVPYKGCLDLDRGLFEVPEGLNRANYASAMAVDVGQERFWGLYWALVSTDPNDDVQHIMAATHKRMPAGTENGLLDWDFEQNVFVGLLEEWHKTSVEAGVPITDLVVEQNAAQRHLFRRNNMFERWQRSRGVRVIPHDTGVNKVSKQLGVEALLPIRYQLGAYRLPWRTGVTQNTMRALFNEAKGYGQNHPTDDILMAQWMLTMKRRQLGKRIAAVTEGMTRDVPDWVRKMA